MVSAVVVRSMALVLGALVELRLHQRPEQPQVGQRDALKPLISGASVCEHLARHAA